MRFEWNESKNLANIRKHGIDSHAASRVFDDPLSLSKLERVTENEQRWQTVGLAEGIAVLLVAHTWRAGDHGEEVVRIISARKATRAERRVYEEGT